MLVKAMVTFNYKHGFLTIYMQTVFVKKGVRDGAPLLLFSPIMKHSDHAAVEKEKESMKSMSI
jgi:hypothetical protein